MGRRALVVSPEVPYPMHGGGRIRTVSLIEYLRRDHEVDLIVFREDSPVELPPGHFNDVREILLTPHSRFMPARLWRNAIRLARQVPPLVDRFSGYEGSIRTWLRDRHYSIAVVEHLWAGSYAPILRPHADRLVLDLHNVESMFLSRLRLPFARFARQLERKWVPAFDTTLVTSAADAAHLAMPAKIYPNAIPTDAVQPPKEDACPSSDTLREICMSGNFDFPPNRLGFEWFRRSIWPVLRARRPQLRLRLVGRGSEHLTLDSGMTATGPVNDALAEIRRAAVAVVPLRAGSGTRLKILEAWAAATPVVSTTLGAEGLTAVHGRELLIADGADGFANAVLQLLDDRALQSSLARNAQDLLQREFTWAAAWRKLDETGALY